MKKFFKISLIIGIFSLFIFWGDFSLALDDPINLTVDCGSGGIDECSLSPSFDWDDVLGAISYLIHYTQTDELCFAIAEGVWTEFPLHPTRSECIVGDPVAPCKLLSASPDRQYCWRVKAEGVTGDSGWTIGPTFHTEELAASSGNGSLAGDPFDLTNPLDADTLQEALNSFLNFLFFLAITLAPILIIYAAFLILTSGGDAAKINRGRQIILWTLIAVALVLFAKGFPALIKGAFGG